MHAGPNEYLEPFEELSGLRRTMDTVFKMPIRNRGAAAVSLKNQGVRQPQPLQSTPPCTGSSLTLGFSLPFMYGTGKILRIEE